MKCFFFYIYNKRVVNVEEFERICLGGERVGLEAVEELLLLGGGIVYGQDHLTGLARLERVGNNLLLRGGPHFPRLVYDHCVASLRPRHELCAVAHIPSHHPHLPRHAARLSHHIQFYYITTLFLLLLFLFFSISPLKKFL